MNPRKHSGIGASGTAVLLTLLFIGDSRGAEAQAAQGSFAAVPVFDARGLASVVFMGGTVDQLETAALAAGANGSWAQDSSGAFQLLVVGGPSFLKDGFKTKFPSGFGVTAFTLTRAQPGSIPSPAQRPLPARSAFQKGMTFADWRAFTAPRSGLYAAPGTDEALRNLAATGANWIALVVGCGQENAASTSVVCSAPRTATDAELRHVIDLAHALGIRVLLKPQLDFSAESDPSRFRGHIGSAFTTAPQWEAWFASYRQFMTRYAALAEAADVDMLSIGVELGGTTHREEEWRTTIREVRRVFSGPITYSSLSSTGAPPPHGEEKRIVWWDAVDYIGVDAYYPLTNKNDPTVAELKEAWTSRGYPSLLEDLSRKFAKPLIFTEFGYRSVDGASRTPGAYLTKSPVDLQEQADAYQAALEVLWGRPWLAGIFWWQWFADPRFGGVTNDDFTPFGKPAEQMLRTFSLRQVP